MRPGPSVGPHRSGGAPDWLAAGVTLSLLSGKWVVATLSVLSTGPRRQGAVHQSIGAGVSSKVLTETLRRMQRHGLLTRRVVDRDGRAAVMYALTPLGKSLLILVESLAHWAHTHPEHPAGQLRRDR